MLLKKNDLALELKKHPGVSLHGKRIRLSFQFNSKRHFETLNIPITKTNVKVAANKLAAIKHEIAIGSFSYSKHFPNSKKGQLYEESPICQITVKEALEKFLETVKLTRAPSTYKAYNNKVHNHVIPKFGSINLATVTQSEIKLWIAKDLRALSPKTINNINVPFRAIFNNAQADGVIDRNPFDYIKQLKEETTEPDPFTKAELSTFAKTYTNKESELNAFLFACWTGLRPSELIALAWEDVDFVNATIKVCRGKVDNTLKSTKTDGSTRIIELLTPAIKILEQQKPITYFQSPKAVNVLNKHYTKSEKRNLRFIFSNSNTGEPFSDVSNYRSRFFDPHIRKAGIRYRSVKQARHTFACQLLTAGVDIYWVAKQMGHTSIKMIEKHYGKWMHCERSNMAQEVSMKLGFENKLAFPTQDQLPEIN